MLAVTLSTRAGCCSPGLIGTFVILILLGGCSSTVLRYPVPEAMHQQATVLGQDNLRHWVDREPPEKWSTAMSLSREEILQRFPAISQTEHNYLAISGGGANGAYGAGVLVGWSETGTRPQFAMVTGVSTGALTAPFAYLGPGYDDQLMQVYTTLDSASIFRLRNVFRILRSDSLTDVTPLKKVLERYITDELVAKIAAEYRTGRSLQIATTNLDAERPVIWSLGRIAASGHKDATELIRKIMLASASVPGLFPPVYIKVEGTDGKTYDEMHVDGGASSQIFLYPSYLDWPLMLRKLEVKGQPKAYLIRNSYIEADYEPVQPRLRPILGKSMSSLIRNQGMGDVYRIFTLAQRDGIDLKLTWIPRNSVDVKSDEAFDPEYMSALFDYGYRRASEGKAWEDVIELVEEDTP